MKKLSLQELKAQKFNVIANLEFIKGGDTAGCHATSTFDNNTKKGSC